MIRWCSYCQKFLGEIPPLDEPIFSHGICEKCFSSNVNKKRDLVQKGRNLAELYNHFMQHGINGSLEETLQIAQDCYKLGVRPIDFILGIVEPIFNNSKVPKPSFSINDLVEQMIESKRKALQSNSTDQATDIFVTNLSKGKFSSQKLELWFWCEGFSARALDFSDEGQFLETCLNARPKALYFHCENASESETIHSITNNLKSKLQPPPLFLVGGPAIKNKQIEKEKVPHVLCADEELKIFLNLKSHLSLGFLYDIKKQGS